MASLFFKLSFHQMQISQYIIRFKTSSVSFRGAHLLSDYLSSRICKGIKKATNGREPTHPILVGLYIYIVLLTQHSVLPQFVTFYSIKSVEMW